MRTAPKIDIYYFSGTGNTAWAVHRLAERLTGLGDEVTIASCEQVAASEVDPASCDVMGIAFPVHASFAPPIFRDFLRDLPPDNGKPLFAVTTAGYAAGDTAWYAVRPLREKGYEPFLMDNVLMGNNLYMPGLPALFPSPEKMVPRLGKAKQKNRVPGPVHPVYALFQLLPGAGDTNAGGDKERQTAPLPGA